MTNKLKKIGHYRSSIGLRGTAVFLLSKLTGAKPVFQAEIAGIRHPVYVRIGTTDVSVLKQVLIEKHYEHPFHIAPKVIVDAGANIGISAIYFANQYPEAEIIALEPEESNFKLLQKNAAAYPKIRPLKAALWKETRRISLVDPQHGHHGFRTEEQADDNSSETGLVNAFTVDALMARFGFKTVDLLKIDIEGSEKEVFENSSNWIGRVGTILAELHDELKPGCTRAFTSATKDFSEAAAKGETVMRSREQKELRESKPVLAIK